MVTRNKIQIYKGDKISGEVNLDELTTNSELLSFFETDTIFLELVGNKYGVTVEVGEDISPDLFVVLKENEKILINSNYFQHPSLKYRVEIIDKSTSHTTRCFYSIVGTKAVNLRQFSKMISFIQQFDSECIVDNDGAKLTGNKFLVGNKERKEFFDIAYLIQSEYRKINSIMNAIVQHPSETIIKTIEKNSVLKKQNEKSIIRNTLIFSDKKYSEKLKLFYDTNDNILLKNDLLLCKKCLNKSRDKLLSKSYKLAKILESYSHNDLIKDKGKKERIIRNINDRLLFYDKINKSFQLLYKNIEQLLNSYFLKNVDDKLCIKKRTYDNENYRMLDRILLSQMKYSNFYDYLEVNRNSYMLPFKKTSLLFEYYCFYSFAQAFEDIGLLPQFDLSNIDFENNHAFVFENAFQKIVLKYDEIVPDFFSFDVSGRGVYNICSSHNKPDFVIEYYEDDCFKKAIVCDSKCISANRLIHHVQDPRSLGTTVLNYLSYCYIENENDFQENKRINDLFFICPNEIDSVISDDKTNLKIVAKAIDQLEGNFEEFVLNNLIL